MVIGIIDYRTGNSRSVSYAFDRLGLANRLVTSPGECTGVDRYVLPGVGSARVTMESLRDKGWDAHLEQVVRGDSVPFLGICVGLQVLLEHSDEGDVECLGWIPGAVRHFDRSVERVPHMGWNEVTTRGNHPFAASLRPGGHYYFVNSYYAVPTDPSTVAGETTYGQPFAAVLAKDNVVATQFHTEKSATDGLALLRAFATGWSEES